MVAKRNRLFLYPIGINKSKAKWKIAFGHQPWVSIGDHGNAPRKLQKYFKELFAVVLTAEI